ncbi:hypothetical protein DM02DRAFT_629629 [Periconia macrospinosa]|uniref:Velvet domain-containing protein n=1 Tax=Periconia macrospinosa TaxID=97972 RepID=A0A2V1DNF1_9PLEO|nr:hypothetical protein DM02DRAFT_629629 [Periconia macrospinosa]
MANVTRSRGHASTSVRSRQPLGNNNRRPRPNRQSASPDDIQYAMDIVVQPPSTSRAGYAINGTVIVRLRTANVYADDANRDSYHLTALASLIPAGSSSGSSDPRALDRLLGGRRYVSVHPFSDDEADGSIAAMELDDPRGVGLMHFPDLSIHQAGTYRIRITLIRIPNLDAPTISGGEHIQAIDSNPIDVQNTGSASRSYEVNGGNQDDGGWNDTIREISMRQRSR